MHRAFQAISLALLGMVCGCGNGAGLTTVSTITAMSPASGATGVSTATAIRFDFSLAADPAEPHLHGRAGSDLRCRLVGGEHAAHSHAGVRPRREHPIPW